MSGQVNSSTPGELWWAILVTVRWWFEQSRTNAAVFLEAAILGSLMALSNLVYRGSAAYSSLPAPTKVALRVWMVARRRFHHPNQWSPFFSVVGEPSLPHFRMLPDPQLGARFGIKVLKDIMPAGELLSFRDLAIKYRLPGWMIFQYYQLRNAAKAQFPTVPSLKADAIEELLAQESLDKPLSTLYLALLRVDSPKMDALWEKMKDQYSELRQGGMF